MTLTLVADTSRFMAAMDRLAEAVNRFGRAFMLEQMKPHAFNADFDLRCTAPGCTLLPEEH